MTSISSDGQERAGQIFRSGILISILIAVAYFLEVRQFVGPLAATCALLALLPNAPFSKPRTMLVSHVICLGVGLVLTVLPLHPLLGTLAGIWIAIIGMSVFRAVHAPAVAHTAIILLASPPLGKFVAGVALVIGLFSAFSYFYNRAAPLPARAKPDNVPVA